MNQKCVWHKPFWLKLPFCEESNLCGQDCARARLPSGWDLCSSEVMRVFFAYLVKRVGTEFDSQDSMDWTKVN